MLQIFTLFTEGLLSFLSPCVLPIIPIYLGILGSNTLKDSSFPNKLKNLNIIFFIIGICTTFFLLAFAGSILSKTLMKYRQILSLIGAVIIIMMGCFQLGIIKSQRISKEFSLKGKMVSKDGSIRPMTAYIMGLTFSFAWTPCVGPILASVFFYATSQPANLTFLFLSIYCVGFIIPFIVISLCSEKIYTYLKSKYHLLQYSSRISGTLLLLMGSWMLWSTLIKIGG